MSAKIFIIFVVFTVVFIHLCCMGGKEVGRKTYRKQNSFPKSTYTPPPGASGHNNTEAEKGKTKIENKEEKPKNKRKEDESDLEEGEFNPKYYKYTSKQKLWTG
ncbi:unnamed protein product [Meloidogyne enterolobii]|uniref:Uncharacterized protein n=1 Tax=Meloidogyne enterolobii TaxID=390850 RepID=A0ACB0ZQZ9_MELEN